MKLKNKKKEQKKEKNKIIFKMNRILNKDKNYLNIINS